MNQGEGDGLGGESDAPCQGSDALPADGIWAYAHMQCSLQHEWNFLQQVTSSLLFVFKDNEMTL